MTIEQTVLKALLKTANSGQGDIFRAAHAASAAALREQLAAQLVELDAIESAIQALPCRRGWELGHMESRPFLQLPYPNSDSRIAERLILRWTKSIITLKKIRHSCNMDDPQLDGLLQKLVDCQQANIRKLMVFL